MRKVRLSAIRDEDLELLCQWRNSPEFFAFCSQHVSTVEVDKFAEELAASFKQGRHWQSIICPAVGEPCGTIYSYDYSKRNKYCFVSVYVQNHRAGGIGLFATMAFCYALFRELSLYKIYFEVHEHNTSVVKMLRKCGLPVEGRFKGHQVFGESRYDTLRFALYPDKFQEIMFRFRFPHESF